MSNAPKQHIPPVKSVQISPEYKTEPPNTISHARRQIVDTAVSSIGAPYKWGGASPEKGFDCSGLVQYAYKEAGIILPRTTKSMLASGHSIPKKQLLPGDLVFFHNPGADKNFHVGIFIEDNSFIHAPGRGRTVTAASLENQYFKRNYIGSRRMLQQAMTQ